MEEAVRIFEEEDEADVTNENLTDANETVKILTEEIFNLKNKQKELEEETEDVKTLRIQKEDSLYKLLQNMGAKSIRTKFGTFTRGINFRAYYHEEDREKVVDWLKDIGCDEIVKPVVNSNTFTAFIKERMEMNEKAGMKPDHDIPEFVLSFTKDKIRFRKK